jgi:serine/threonine protein kinase
MPTKIGHFEILSELAKSSAGAVYKANDPQSGQTVALKAIQLSAFGESAGDLEKSLLQEAEDTKVLSSSNITPIYGAGEMEGLFCAAMEYVQGNSIATMLARKEGFSIWDLLDIGRQVCGGLDHAHSHQVFHFNLEPAKIMCGWDGTVKILGFGLSSVGKFAHKMPGGAPGFLAYMSPEQIRGEVIDSRSNLFTLGAIFYEMVTERKAFDREDAESLRQSIVESTPVPPVHVNPKIHPVLSHLIMRALDKDPTQRYQRGRELLDDLEKCKDSKPAADKKPVVAAKASAVPVKVKAEAQSKFIAATPVQPSTSTKGVGPRPAAKSAPVAASKKSAAAAGVGGSVSASPTPRVNPPSQVAKSSIKPTVDASVHQSASMSSAVADEPEVETFTSETPKIAVDPMMAEDGPSGRSGGSFSEINELPPLKDVYVAPEPPPSSPVHASAPAVTMFQEPEEKPKVPPREVAKKAIKEIQSVPPRLMLYSLVGAGVLILLIIVGFLVHIHSLNSDDDAAASRANAAAETPAQPATATPAPPQASPAPVVPEASAPANPETVAEPEPARSGPRARNGKRKTATAAAPVLVPGQMLIDSTPQGAQVLIDGASDPRWVTPVSVPGLKPGQHSVTVNKPGYSTDARTVDVTSGSKSTILIHLAELMGALSVKSDPAGANVYIDGRDTGKTTPAQISVAKGQHVMLVRMMGYIDETTNAQFVAGQTVTWSPALRPLGNADNIRTVGKMKKLFGGNGAQGQVAVTIRTQPKGAQIAINQRMLEKGSPVEVMLDPGNYVIDISLTGYAPIHKVITADRGNKVVIDETLQPQ